MSGHQIDFRITFTISAINEIIMKINNDTNKAIFTNLNGYNDKLLTLVYNEKPDFNISIKSPDCYFCVDLSDRNEATIEELIQLKENLNCFYKDEIDQESLVLNLNSSQNNIHNEIMKNNKNNIKYRLIAIPKKLTLKELFLGSFLINFVSKRDKYLYVCDNLDEIIDFSLNKIVNNNNEYKGFKYNYKNGGWDEKNTFLIIDAFDPTTQESCNFAHNENGELVNLTLYIHNKILSKLSF